jgi:hypothetical protein
LKSVIRGWFIHIMAHWVVSFTDGTWVLLGGVSAGVLPGAVALKARVLGQGQQPPPPVIDRESVPSYLSDDALYEFMWLNFYSTYFPPPRKLIAHFRAVLPELLRSEFKDGRRVRKPLPRRIVASDRTVVVPLYSNHWILVMTRPTTQPLAQRLDGLPKSWYHQFVRELPYHRTPLYALRAAALAALPTD